MNKEQIDYMVGTQRLYLDKKRLHSHDSKILINSICNLEKMNQSAFSFGKNRQNVNRFIDTFTLLLAEKTPPRT